jgi:nitroreductase
METIEAIKTRRSIRTFSDEMIPEEQLIQILTCGMYAPSAGNQQPWQFILIQDKQVLQKIPDIHEHAHMMSMASAGILICIDSSLEKHKNMAVQDCSAATQNILLAAHALDIGSCWLGVYPREKRMNELRKMLRIPDSVIPFSLIALGIYREKKEQVERFNIQRIHRETWGQH